MLQVQRRQHTISMTTRCVLEHNRLTTILPTAQVPSITPTSIHITTTVQYHGVSSRSNACLRGEEGK